MSQSTVSEFVGSMVVMTVERNDSSTLSRVGDRDTDITTRLEKQKQRETTRYHHNTQNSINANILTCLKITSQEPSVNASHNAAHFLSFSSRSAASHIR